MKKLVTLLLLALLSFVESVAVEIEGIYYSLNSSDEAKTASVVSSLNPNGLYSGDVVIPECVTFEGVTYDVISIGNEAFYACYGLTSVVIPNSVTSIGDWAFRGCVGLTSVTIPNSVTSIGGSAFNGCSSLTSITIPNSVTSIGGSAFLGCSGLTSVTIPNSVTSIGTYAFSGCSSLTSVTIPNSVTSIGGNAFRDCSGLTSVTIPNSVTSIGGSAFYGCKGLLNVTLSDNITSIEDNTFRECSGLLSINIPKGVTSIGQSALYRCESLTSIELPGGLTSIGDHAFWGCKSVTAINIPQGITQIEKYVFFNCYALASVKLPETLTSIGDNAFSWCGITSITIPESVTSIGESAFNGCPFSAINLPSTLKIIKGSTFNYCSNLESITIPATVEYIYQEAFANCRNLKSVKSLAATPPFLYDNSFSNYEIPLSVPEGARDAYLAASPWNKFKEILSGADTKYKLTYKVDGEVYKTYDLLEGTAITPEAEPTKEGYDFSGWSTIPATMPAEDVTITGSFSLLTDEDEITIKDIGKTTWCSKYDLDFTNVAGIKAYTATGYNDVTKTIWLTRVMEVPAGTGLLVKGDAGTYKIPHVSVRAYYTNMLVGNLGNGIKIEETDGDKTNYYLSGKDGSFVSVNGSANIGKNKAYLQLPTSVFGGTRSIGISYDDEDGTTSIKNLTTDLTEGEGEWYTLQGQRVAKPGKGLYIRNGKKVIVR